MHNLLLGTAKHMFQTWTDKGILKPKDLKEIQDYIDRTVVPPDVGRIPNKLEAGASGMTADQWKNWTLIYSPYILSTILPHNFSTKTARSRQYLAFVLPKVESLYGKDSITPYMHLHCHLAECIRDYGPVYAFWCFSFERYNGILGTYQHNSKALPIQMMRKFLEDESLTASVILHPIFLKSLLVKYLSSMNKMYQVHCANFQW